MRMSLLIAASAAALLAACSNETAPAPVAAEPARAALGEWGVDPSTGDEAGKPGDDVLRYARAKRPATFPRPEEQARQVALDHAAL